jgi:PAS domain-containing protein
VLIGVSVLVVIISGLYAKEQRDDLQRQLQRATLFKGMITAPEYGLVILNPDGNIVEWGKGAEKLFGWQAGQVDTKALDVVLDPTLPLREVNCWASRKDGQVIPVHFVAAAFNDDQGRYHATIFVAGHVTKPIVLPLNAAENQVTDLNTMVGWNDE